MTTKKRKIYIDITKSLAIIFVLAIHMCTLGGYDAPVKSFNFGSTVFLGSITRSAVPLFLMCIGALIFEPSKALSLKELYLHNILRLLVALYFLAALYKVYDLWLYNGFADATFKSSVKELAFFNHESHLYYIHISLRLYMFFPIGRIFIAYATKRQLLFWLVFGILYPTVNQYFPLNEIVGIPRQYLMNMTYSAIGYAMLEYYVKKYTPRLQICIASLISGVLLTFLFTLVLSIKHNGLYEKMF